MTEMGAAAERRPRWSGMSVSGDMPFDLEAKAKAEARKPAKI